MRRGIALLAAASSSASGAVAPQQRGAAAAVRLEAAASSLAHPDKQRSEDAHFLCGRAFGVFDGVGGWTEQGVDVAAFSRALAEQAAASLSDDATELGRPVEGGLCGALQAGLELVQLPGSSTACLVCIDERGKLSALNLGDSGYRLLRPAAAGVMELVTRSEQQQHAFNYPFQIGHFDSSDRPEDGVASQAQVAPGDLLLLATDGVFDNLHDEELAALAAALLLGEAGGGADADAVARAVADGARAASQSSTRSTPFAASAREHGRSHAGGKMDDVTVIAVKVLGGGAATQPTPRSRL